MENPRVHLILVPDNFEMIMDKRARDLKEFEAFKKNVIHEFQVN